MSGSTLKKYKVVMNTACGDGWARRAGDQSIGRGFKLKRKRVKVT